MLWFNMITYWVVGPLLFGMGEGHIAQRAEAMNSTAVMTLLVFYPGLGRREV